MVEGLQGRIPTYKKRGPKRKPAQSFLKNIENLKKFGNENSKIKKKDV